MKRSFNFLSFLFSLGLLFTLQLTAKAQEEVRLSRSVELAFEAQPKLRANLQNKYGLVEVHGWEKDSVRLKVSITARAKSQEQAEDILQRVEIQHQHSPTFLSVFTGLDNDETPVLEFFRSLVNDARSVLDESNVEVNYELYLPKGADLTLNNKYGNTRLRKLSGNCTLLQAHGSLVADTLSGFVDLDLRFGKAQIDALTAESLINLRYGELDVHYLKDATVSSTFSELDAEEVEKLRLNSKNDKFFITQVGELQGDALFSRLEIRDLHKALTLEADMGQLHVSRVMPSFKEIAVNSRGTDVFITPDAQTSYQLDLTGKENRTSLPPTGMTGLTQSYTDNHQKYQNSTAVFGPDKKTEKIIRIRAKGGEVRVR